MDRFVWYDSNPLPGEEKIYTETQVKLYDGDDESQFPPGQIELTSHRVIYKDTLKSETCISILLSLVKSIKETAAIMTRSAKIELHLFSKQATQTPGPYGQSKHNFVKLSFRKGGCSEFYPVLQRELSRKKWESVSAFAISGGSSGQRGIAGIERKMEQKRRETEGDITTAFKDLKALMNKAEEMVTTINSFAAKMEHNKGAVVEDETLKLKSCLLSVGIENPVTKSSHGSTTVYHQELAKELSGYLGNILSQNNGIITLTDLYCRFNRARGLELVSPDDLVNACSLFESLKLPIRLKQFDSGVLCVQSSSHSEKQVTATVKELVEKHNCLTCHELANLLSLSVLLAQEHLLLAEDCGVVCRDDSLDGLRFYINAF